MKPGVKITQDQLHNILDTVERLTENEVLVGVPATKTDRDSEEKTPITNAAIGYINEFGSPSQNIPARPHLFPGIRDVQERISARLRTAARSALMGNVQAVEAAQNAVGLMCQNSVRAKITAGLSPALSPRTIEARQTRKIAPRMGTMPLIDTGIYRRAITYVLRRRQDRNGTPGS